MEKIVVLVTVPDAEEAAKIGRALVEERLAACVSIVPSTRSIYRWKGEVCDAAECLLIIKTLSNGFEVLQKRIKQLHSYELPEVIALAIAKGSEEYLKWVEESSWPESK